MTNNVDPDQTAPIGAVCSGSTLFASILNLSVMLGNYLQQATSADVFSRLILHVRDHENKKYKSSCQYIHSRQHIYNTLKVIVTVNCGELIQGVRS